ncbi:mannonate dehydratase [Flavobacteriaceae bacterium F89]|uniref:Mannonate dehydratase n=1 Tax=Cerina litoralis TaxID=2874477 RepID=A0AAE3EX05_9FLAO|nr:mannonate dehydratase [Cerina litoralis]MCG2462428.1 mannonate dehydratase [Cerina litoralis]
MDYLKKTFRWFGPSFGVSLGDIKQLGVEGIVTACHDVPTGEVWSSEKIALLKSVIEEEKMDWSVVESVNIHPAIKYGSPDRDLYIQNYIETLKNLAEHQIFIVCYNFMPLLDWTRTDLHYNLPNGSKGLNFDPLEAVVFDLYIAKRRGAEELYDKPTKERAKAHMSTLGDIGLKRLENAILAGFPGSKENIPLKFLKRNMEVASKLNKEKLRENLAYFLKAVTPVAETLGIQMALHPDDPPFPVFGIPRIASNYQDLKFVLECCPSLNNGLTFCSGSLGANPENDLPQMIKDFGDKIHFVHLRNIEVRKDGSFYESTHLKGSIPMKRVVQALVNEQRKRLLGGRKDIAIPLRPDHGHVLLCDKEKENEFYPGYSLIGRALGLAELSGLEQGIRDF